MHLITTKEGNKMKDVKCYIVNKDLSIYEYEILEKVKTFQVELVGKSKARYIIANFGTLKEAKEYCERITKRSTLK